MFKTFSSLAKAAKRTFSPKSKKKKAAAAAAAAEKDMKEDGKGEEKEGDDEHATVIEQPPPGSYTPWRGAVYHLCAKIYLYYTCS